MSIELYGKAYQQEYQKREQSELGRKIYKARWDFIEKFCHGPMTLLDYGCAGGAFHLSSTNGFVTAGYDINPCSPFNNIKTVEYRAYQIITFWDSLEHVPDFYHLLRKECPRWIFLSTPNLESVKGPIASWKHYKPGEHIFYFDQHSLKAILGSLGYEVRGIEFEEGFLRNPNDPEAIISMAFERRS